MQENIRKAGGKVLAAGAVVTGLVVPAMAAEPVTLDEISVTATRLERKTAEVPATIAVISGDTIEERPQFNIKDTLTGTPGVLIDSANQGYDSRLIIRGAGLKARYGVREIMVLRDGVPVTDPDSFTRLDMIDTQLIDRVEVVKGPNSTLWGANAAGGVINIISKNPLDRQGGNLRLAVGEFDSQNVHLDYAGIAKDKLYWSGSFSHRQSDNDWRRWNEFSTTQVSLQPNLALDDGTMVENMFSYSKADLQLPGSLNQAMFAAYEASGEARQTDGPWQYSGRYSESYFFSSKVTKEWGGIEFIPLVYANAWEHHHPVTGRINDADTFIIGADVQANYRHRLAGQDATLTGGVTARFDSQDTDYFKYADFATAGGRITAVLSDRVGSRIEVEERDTRLWGVYLQESLRLGERTLVDLGLRYDSIDFDIKSTQWGEYSWARGRYIDYAAPVGNRTEKSYDALSPRIGISYRLTPALHLFAAAASGVQTPTEGEISDNPNLELVEVENYEVGIKGRGEGWSFDSSVYYSPVENEVVQVRQGAVTDYVNAGETDKRGFEFSGSLEVLPGLRLGGSYSYTDYTYEQFTEPVRVGFVTTNVDRSGNTLPFIPRHQYSLTADYRHPSGFKCSVQSHSWGSYYVDNANSEKYAGYDLVTNVMVGFVRGPWDLSVNVDNLFDERYSTETSKDTSGKMTYKPAAPRRVLARLTVRF